MSVDAGVFEHEKLREGIEMIVVDRIVLLIMLLVLASLAFAQYNRSGLVLGDPVGTWMSDETCSVGSHIVFGYTDRGVPVLRCEQDLSPL